jgi:alkylation response protein AidB-like acyl-CoA dehydrogenase
MSTTQSDTDRQQTFAETAMRLGGKSDEEARRMGALDRADDQVEHMFAPQYQTVNSPVHKAVWEKRVPVELFMPPPLPASAPCDGAMERSVEIVRRHREAGTVFDEHNKVSDTVLGDLAQAGYWGMLIDPKFGGQGAPFQRFTRFLTRVAMQDATCAGLASVHGCIGAVDPVRTFGSAEQKTRFLPRLASGESLSGFALTEPAAGSDLTALRTRAVLVGDHYEVTGEKLFITNAVPGRTIGLVVKIDDKPAVLIVELPREENEQFQMVNYGLYALKHTWNRGLKFNKLRVPRENLLVPKQGDGLTIAYHGLNLGRLSLCATAAGSMRAMLANILPWAHFRRTYGAPIETRELVKRRVGHLAGLIVAADALVAWGSWLIDQGYRGELECIVAKIFGSESQKEAAIELFMKTHGGRSFLHGHVFGDNVHELLAPCIYEGEGEVLGLAFFKSLIKEHGKQFFEPIGKGFQAAGINQPNMNNPRHAWAVKGALWSYSRWYMGQKFGGRQKESVPGTDPRLADHLAFAQEQFGTHAREISSAMVKHQLKLADRQCRMSELSSRVQDAITILVTALHAHQKKDEVTTAAADVVCQDLRRKLTGERPSDAYFRAVSKLADTVIGGGFEALAGSPIAEILMQYPQ